MRKLNKAFLGFLKKRYCKKDRKFKRIDDKSNILL